MIVTRETVVLEGILMGEGRQRVCRVRATRRQAYADECMRPVCVSYSRCEIDDGDDFPEGEYELNFERHRILFRKREGQYIRSSEFTLPSVSRCELS